ncbi:MAG: tRNA methyltransferase, has a role in tRNA modification [Bathelium mastoideum]|nr:MAG: tRNA methyltransferase, has a role in tRNA modification [Bathelium mastoideum]
MDQGFGLDYEEQHVHSVPSYYDFAISIAVVHHLSTEERRIQAIKATLECLKPAGDPAKCGRALLYVWALEQKSSRRGWDQNDEQDVMVPWVTKNARGKTRDDAAVPDGAETQTTYYRYYHLYREGELERDVSKAGGVVLEAGYEKDNWWAIVARPDAK